MDTFQGKFFGSKLNTILLLILIILMIGAIRIMLQTKELYLHPVSSFQQSGVTPVVLGNKDDLVSFSITPGQKVSKVITFTGSVKNSYFFEGNILIDVLDAAGNNVLKSNAKATTDWMTSGPVSFSGSLDLSSLAPGYAYIEIHNDNASGLAQNDKSILIPVVIQ